MYLFNKILVKMGSNYNRFVPNHWLRAAQFQQGFYGNDHGNSYGWWPPSNNFCYPHNGRDRVTGAYHNTSSSFQEPYRTTGVEFKKTSRTHSTMNDNRTKDYLSLDNNNARNLSKDSFSKKKHRSPNQPKFSDNKSRRYFSQMSPPRHSTRRDRENEPFQKVEKFKKRKFDGPSTSSALDEFDSSNEEVSPETPMKGDDIEKFRLERNWEEIKPPSNIDTNSTTKKQIRVVSYNILSQKLLHLNKKLYWRCDSDILRWNYRWKILKSEIEEFDADVLCFQEVEQYHYRSEILEFLETMGYECQYKKRTGNNPNKPDGVLIAYKRNKFQLHSLKNVEYFRGNFSPVNQDNVGLITLLKPLQEDSTPMNECICVVNTHLLYNPKRGDIKLVQLATLLAEVHKAISNHNSTSRIPIILCGDFNSTADSHLVNFIKTQKLSLEGVLARNLSGQRTKGKDVFLPSPLLPKCLNISEEDCTFKPDSSEQCRPPDVEPAEFQINHSAGPLISAYSHDKPEASTTQDKGITVDFIFHTPVDKTIVSATDGKNLNLYPCKRLGLIHPEEIWRANGLPNAIHPSDHLPIVVDFVLTY